MFGDFDQRAMEALLPWRRIERRDKTVCACASFDWPRDETCHIEACIAEYVQQVREYARTCDKRNKRQHGFVFHISLRTRLFQQFSGFLAWREHKKISLCALIILHGGTDARHIVEFTANTWPESYFVCFDIATCGSIGWRWSRLQMVFRDETFALRETMRVCGSHGGVFRIGSRTHICVESYVDAHSRKSD